MRWRWPQRCFLTVSFVVQLVAASDSARTPSQWKMLDQKISADERFFEFATRPDIQAPVWSIAVNEKSAQAPGYWFIAPYEEKTQELPGEGWVGPHIYDSDGQLVWSGTPMFGHWNVFDFSPSEVDGVLHLSGLDWHGQRGVVLDSSYEIKKTASSIGEGDTFQNMHGFHVIENGTRALVQTVHRWDVPPNITYASAGYNGTCEAHYQGFREVDLTSEYGTKVLFDWNAHQIGLNESTYFSYGPTAEKMCKRGWDLLHVNAVDKCPDGDYLLSARHTDALYKISHITGEIVWRLGGVMSDFVFAEGAKFSRQHHARCQQQNKTHMLISLFDNAVGEHYSPPSRHNSRALVLSLDLEAKTADISAQFQHPQNRLTDGRGSFQTLPNGHAFVDWAVASRISEHLPNGTVILMAALKFRADSYRAFKSPWVGTPSTLPDVHSEIVWKRKGRVVTVVSMSWNGATEVDRWNVRGFDSDGMELQIADGVQRTGFETTIQYDGLATDVSVQALDMHGSVLSDSKGDVNTVPASPPTDSGSFAIWGIVGAFLIGLAISVAGVLGFHLYKRRSELPGASEKGEYKAVEQDEE